MSEATIDEATIIGGDEVEDDDGPVTQPSPPSSAHPCAELAARLDATDARVTTNEGRLDTVESRLASGETRFGTIEARVESLHKKQDAQTEILSRVDKATAVIATGVEALAKTRIGRAILIAIGLAIAGWLAKHGIKVEVPK